MLRLVKRLTPKPRKNAANLLAATDSISTDDLHSLIGYATGLVASCPRYPAVVPFDLADHRTEVVKLIQIAELVSDDALRILLMKAKPMATERQRPADVVQLFAPNSRRGSNEVRDE